MSANDATLFIDANAYLHFYRAPSTRQLVKSLLAQHEYVFITEQIVNEIERNKLIVAQRFFMDLLERVKPVQLPEHLFDAATQEELIGKAEAANSLHESLGAAAAHTLEKISKSEDEMSKALNDLFKNSVKHSVEQLARARIRKERGNPPGKSASIGDELNWEQLLAHTDNKSRIWIISDDRDYCVKHQGKLLLNPFLRHEMGNKEVFCFENLAKGIRDFANVTGEGKKELPSPDKLEGIEKEIEVSPPPWWFGQNVSNDPWEAMIATAKLQAAESLYWKRALEAMGEDALSSSGSPKIVLPKYVALGEDPKKKKPGTRQP